ncbi:Endopolyphosphatase [Coemansia sp. Benny D115]|nr:Endopolyphosphatase [Coemansia sp. Benny D115]
MLMQRAPALLAPFSSGSTTYSQCHRLPPSVVPSSASRTVLDKDGHKDTGRFGIAEAKCDTPVALINATAEYLRKTWADDLDFVIWTGDSGRHDNDAEIPRTFDEIILQNHITAGAMRHAFGHHGIPVVPNIGNNDISPHNELAAPGHKRARKTFKLLADAWRGFIPENQLATFLYGGYFARDVVDYDKGGRGGGRRGITALSLNTIYWYRANNKVGGCAAEDSPGLAQLAWIRYQMRRARRRNRDLILLGHVVPNRDNYRPTCYHGYARTVTQVIPPPPIEAKLSSSATTTKTKKPARSGDQDLPQVHAQLFGHSNVDVWSFVGQEIEWLESTTPLGNNTQSLMTKPSTAANSQSSSGGDEESSAPDKRLWWEREVDEETGRFGKLIRDVWTEDSVPATDNNKGNNRVVYDDSTLDALFSAVNSGAPERNWADMEDDPAVQYVQHSSSASSIWPVVVASGDASKAQTTSYPDATGSDSDAAAAVSGTDGVVNATLATSALPGNFVEALLKEFERVLVQNPRPPRLGVTTISPSIIPKYVPSFRIFYYARAPSRKQWKNLALGTLLDYDVYWANLPELNKKVPEKLAEFFQPLYRFSSAYKVPDLSVDSYLRWAQKLVSSKSLRKRFRSLTYLDT